MKNKGADSKAQEAPTIDPDGKAVEGQRKAVKIDPRTFCFGWERNWGNVSWFTEER